MSNEKILTRLPSANSEVLSAARPRLKKSRWRPDATVVWVENEKCALIPLTKGEHAIVDFDMFDEINRWNWHCIYPYAARSKTINKKQGVIWMHIYIAQTPEGLLTDHINTNGLDNRRSNLRAVTDLENRRNCHARKNNKLGLRGVCLFRSKYRATISLDKKFIQLGDFQTPEEAHAAYSAASAKFHGEFGRTS